MMIRLLGTVVVVGAALFTLGCEREIDSSDPVQSLPEALAAPVGLSVGPIDRGAVVSWSPPPSGTPLLYRVYTADSTIGQEFAVADSTSATSLTISALTANRIYKFTVAAVDSLGVEGERAPFVTATVGQLSLSIAGGDRFTNSRVVQLQLSASAGASTMRLSERPDFTDASSQPFSGNEQFRLTDGDGTKVVYAELTFSDGSATGAPLLDSILLDRVATIDSVIILPNQPTFTAGDTILFRLDAGEPEGDAAVLVDGLDNLDLFDDGSTTNDIAGDGVYQNELIVPNDLTIDGASVTGTFVDPAGNRATDRLSDQRLTIANPPLAVSIVSLTLEENLGVRVRWSQAATTNFARYLIYRANSAAVDETSTLIGTVTSNGTLSLVDTTAAPNTTVHYRVFVENTLGLTAGSGVSNLTTPANDPPQAVTLAGAFSESTNIRLTWTVSDAPDFASYRIYRSTGPSVSEADQLVAILTSSGTTEFTDFVTVNTMRYRIYVVDRFGASTGSNTVTVTR